MNRKTSMSIILALSLICLTAGRSTLNPQISLRPQNTKSPTSRLFMRQAEEPPVVYLEETTPYAGGLGGNLFDDGFHADRLHAGPCQINFNADDWVLHGIQLVWDNGDGSCGVTNEWHGGSGATASNITVSRSKRISKVSVWVNNITCVKAIQFSYEDGEKTDPIGNIKGLPAYSFNIKGNLVGFQGRGASFIDSISFISVVPSDNPKRREAVYWASEPYGVVGSGRFQQIIPSSFKTAKNIYFYLSDENDEIRGVNLDNLNWSGSPFGEKKCNLSLTDAAGVSTFYNGNNIAGVSLAYDDGSSASCGVVSGNSQATSGLGDGSTIVGIYGYSSKNAVVNALGWIFLRSG